MYVLEQIGKATIQDSFSVDYIFRYSNCLIKTFLGKSLCILICLLTVFPSSFHVCLTAFISFNMLVIVVSWDNMNGQNYQVELNY